MDDVSTEGISTTFLADSLLRSHGLRARDFAFLGGEWDRNYRLTTDAGETYLVKVHFPVRDVAELHWQEAILVHLEGKDPGVAVPRIVRALDGARHVALHVGDDRGLVRVLHWVWGTELSRVGEHSTALLHHIGATAAAVSSALAGFTSPTFHQTHHWDLARSGDVIRDALDADPVLAGEFGAEVVLSRLAAVEPILAALPRTVVHHDLNDNNVLVGTVEGRQRVSGVLDFNDALHGMRVAEPAIAGAYAMLRKDDPLWALGHVVAGYHAVTRLTDGEIDAIFPLATARLCMQVLTWTVRARTQPTAYGAMRMQHTVPALARLLGVAPAHAAERLHAACAEAETRCRTGESEPR
ncbi:phosphotransferase [Mycobacterium yunnanensis]|uniref:Hydroxylysine kinase n=1 Tax=Mycobacterium yunnanensis TaxID=368477 RepID=A0A9X3BSD4_9MYCO|nr:phosphotransferase [Mycobacterium yunnanensis]MCV7420469.1 phosphotransferase [Mycobacterium yunnanensis]